MTLLQEESDTIEEQYKLERQALEKKYRDLKTPLWEKRQQIVTGEYDVEISTEIGVPTAEGN